MAVEEFEVGLGGGAGAAFDGLDVLLELFAPLGGGFVGGEEDFLE